MKKYMRRVFLAVVLAVGLLLPAGRASAGYLGGLEADALESLVEESVGRTVVISFWATWCAPCRQEVPGLKALRESVPDSDMLLIGVSLDYDETALKNYADDMGLNYPVYLGGDEVADRYGVQGIPKLMVWDAQGTLRVDHVGYLPDDAMSELVMQFVGE